MSVPGRPLRIESLRDTGRDGTVARLIGLPAEVRALHRAVLDIFLTTGHAPHLDDLPPGDGLDRIEALRRLSEVDLVHLGSAGRVVVAYPFSARATGHTVRFADGPILHAMCAIDALGIPLMTRRDAVIESADPRTGQPIRVEHCCETWRWTPADTAVLLAHTARDGSAAACLCPTITFHTSRCEAEQHLARHPKLAGEVLDQPSAVEIARHSFAALLDHEAPPRSPRRNQ